MWRTAPSAEIAGPRISYVELVYALPRLSLLYNHCRVLAHEHSNNFFIANSSCTSTAKPADWEASISCVSRKARKA